MESLDTLILVGAFVALLAALWYRFGRTSPAPVIQSPVAYGPPPIIESYRHIAMPHANRILAEQHGVEEALAHAETMKRIGDRVKAIHSAPAPPPSVPPAAPSPNG